MALLNLIVAICCGAFVVWGVNDIYHDKGYCPK